MSDAISRSRSRSRSHRRTKKDRKPLDEAALESLVSKRLAKWLSEDSEEIKLLAQFCATMAHSEENWQAEIKEEVESFLHEDTNDFIAWLDRSRWEDEIDAKFGKAALKLKQRVLEEASGKVSQPAPRDRQVKTEQREPHSNRGKTANTGTVSGGGQKGHPQGSSARPGPYHGAAHSGYAQGSANPNRPNAPHGSQGGRQPNTHGPRGGGYYGANSSYNGGGQSLPPATHGFGSHSGQSKVSLLPNRRGDDNIETVQIGFSATSSTFNSKPQGQAGATSGASTPQSTNGKTLPKMKIAPSMAVAEYDYSKDEYQNLTLDNEVNTDRAEQRRLLDTGRKKLLEQNTKLLQRVLAKLNDPSNNEKQKEQLAAMIAKIKAQMSSVKPPDSRAKTT